MKGLTQETIQKIKTGQDATLDELFGRGRKGSVLVKPGASYLLPP